ncbi:hypothetical protein SCHPADRAFT_936818 [Schizopora paradoxa]|uniref:Protein-S-isoprenylcysteine O-methyltransferase n=1 Tax=Schizopora paradoxa TaxID=27342 RepID=A0A0H2S7Z8_9AGAM|nr:hypothetical protein SCHPADRAFT_936818 [Schizopora paradoxa]
MDFHVLLKVVLLSIACKSFVTAWTPPNPPAQKIARDSFFERRGRYVAGVLKAVFLTVIGFDILSTTLFSGMFDPHGIANGWMCPSTKARPRELSMALRTPSMTIALSVAILAISAASRSWCYRTLGNQFRFEVSIQEKHRLVSSGPYAFVRHPAYLAMYGVYMGSTGILTSKGTWLRECVLETPTNAFVGVLQGRDELKSLFVYPVAEYVMLGLLGVMLAVFVGAERGLRGRMVWEEEVLKREFGREWDGYARRVPWRVVPFVY